jgi:aromatic ring-opening dioxygenase LigB subunit
MKGILCGVIMPHGFSIIEEIAGNEKELFKPTRDAVTKLGKKIMTKKPDTVIVLTPHGLRLKDYNAIYTCNYCRGNLSANGATVSLDYECDTKLAIDILIASRKAHIPVVGCNFGALSGTASNIEMDWGTLIPLWFCKDDSYKPKIVVINPTRDIKLDQLIKLGETISSVCSKSNKRFTLIASADQGHCHDESGPYGYNSASKEYDELICDIVKRDKLIELLDIDSSLVANAMPDSLWQMLILYGALKDTRLKGELLSYQAPTYFGMMVAGYFED